MRRILVDHARDRKRLKRGGGRVRLELLDQAGSLAEDPDLVLSLDELLTRLGEEDAAAARVAHLHLFGGLSVEEAGEALGRLAGGRLPELEVRPGLAPRRPWKNNPESARHFSPGWGIESRSHPGGEPWPSMPHERNPCSWPRRTSPIRRSGPPTWTASAAATPNSGAGSRPCSGPTTPRRCRQPGAGDGDERRTPRTASRERKTTAIRPPASARSSPASTS